MQHRGLVTRLSEARRLAPRSHVLPKCEGAEWIRTFRGTRNEHSDDGGGSLENYESKVGQFCRFIFGSFDLLELLLRKHTFLVQVVPVALDITFLAYVRRTYVQ
jgi:hypothetical protein